MLELLKKGLVQISSSEMLSICQHQSSEKVREVVNVYKEDYTQNQSFFRRSSNTISPSWLYCITDSATDGR